MASPRKVLAADDSRDLLAILGEDLHLRGRDTQSLPILPGKHLEKLEGDSPSVIFVDTRMPVMNEFELAGILKKRCAYRHIPILAASGCTGRLAREWRLAAGYDDFISKPFAISALETVSRPSFPQEDEQQWRQQESDPRI